MAANFVNGFSEDITVETDTIIASKINVNLNNIDPDTEEYSPQYTNETNNELDIGIPAEVFGNITVEVTIVIIRRRGIITFLDDVLGEVIDINFGIGSISNLQRPIRIRHRVSIYILYQMTHCDNFLLLCIIIRYIIIFEHLPSRNIYIIEPSNWKLNVGIRIPFSIVLGNCSTFMLLTLSIFSRINVLI